MDSPDQGVKGIPVTSISFENQTLKLSILSSKIEYEGTLDQENNFIGNFRQSGQSYPMNLSREKLEIEKNIRPQEPIKPYSYYTEDIIFENKKDKIKLAGTLTLPTKDGTYPVVVLITGTGPQNRDEEVLGHKPFLVLADHLTKNGIAVLRFDDRGVAESEGDFKTATDADFATDVEAAVEYLKTRKQIDKKKIGLIGHSEGGIIAPMVTAKSKDIGFIVLWAAPGIAGDKLILLQQELIGKASGMTDDQLQKAKEMNTGAFDIIKRNSDSETLKSELTAYFKQALKETFAESPNLPEDENNLIDKMVYETSRPWMQFFIKYDPADALKDVKCPVLAIYGEKDLQVPSKINSEAIKKGLENGGNKTVTIKELPNLNHLFQECKTGLPNEYSVIEQTTSPTALTEMSNWILTQLK